MSAPSESPMHERRRKVLRALGMTVSGLMVLLVSGIFFFIFRTESAHDEASCPFAKHSERPFEGALVIEEARSCVPEAEERRWIVERPKERFELGRKRLPKERFAPDRTKWTLHVDEEKADQIVLRIEVDGEPFSEFREQDAQK